MIRVNFVMEQHVGLMTYYQNLRHYIETDSRIEANWIDVTYRASEESWWSKVSFLPEHIKGTMVGMRQTRQGLRERSADITFFFTQVPSLLAGSLRKRTPYVLCTDVTPIQYDKMAVYYNHKADKNGLISRYKYRQNRKVFQEATRIVAWSNWTRRSFVEDYDVCEENLEVVPAGVDINCWHPASERVGRDSVRILFVGGEFQRKGGQLLLEAFRGLPKGAAELVLVTRSEVPHEENIRVYNNLQPNSEELISLFQSCDMFVLPTKADTFGIVAVEASATGMPVLMTDVGGAGDIIVDGETGFLLTSGDVDELTDRLRFLIENTDARDRMGAAARKRAEECFDARKNGKKIADILLEVGGVT
ncbi:MAG: glycosyltransferase family 4 protein [Candidatus Promineifilaceae bacterium]